MRILALEHFYLAKLHPEAIHAAIYLPTTALLLSRLGVAFDFFLRNSL